jgi:hypothetical protein
MARYSITYVYREKSRGSRTDPCGTQESIWKGDDIVPEIRTRDNLLVR